MEVSPCLPAQPSWSPRVGFRPLLRDYRPSHDRRTRHGDLASSLALLRIGRRNLSRGAGEPVAKSRSVSPSAYAYPGSNPVPATARQWR